MKIIINESQERILLESALLYEGKQVFPLFDDAFIRKAEILMDSDNERWRQQYTWRGENASIRPVANFFTPYVYISYILNHPSLRGEFITHEYSYYFDDIPILVNNEIYYGVLRISNHRMDLTKSSYASSQLFNKERKFASKNGKLYSFYISIVIPNGDTVKMDMDARDALEYNGIIASEYVYDGNLRTDEMHQLAMALKSIQDGSAEYKFGEPICTVPSRLRASDESVLTELQSQSVTVEPTSLAQTPQQKIKRRRHSKAFKQKQKEKELNKIAFSENASQHVVNITRVTRGITGMYIDGKAVNLSDCILIKKPIESIDPSFKSVLCKGKTYRSEEFNQILGLTINLPFIRGKIEGGEYIYITNGVPTYKLNVSKVNVNGVLKPQLSNLTLISRKVRPII